MERFPLRIVSVGALLLLHAFGIAWAGCAGDSDRTGSPPSSASAAGGEISLSSPAVSPAGKIRDGVTCKKRESWLPLRWSDVPANTAELVLYVGRFENVLRGPSPGLHVPAGSLVLGIDPKRGGLGVGSYPADAAVARYRPNHLCPRRRVGHFTFQLFALSPSQRVAPEDVGVETLTELTLDSLATGRLTAVGGGR